MTILSWLSSCHSARMMPQSFARCSIVSPRIRRKKKATLVGRSFFFFMACDARSESSGWDQGCQCKKQQSESGDDECGTANLSCVSLFGLPANAGEVPIYGSPADLISQGRSITAASSTFAVSCVSMLGISL